MCMYFCYRMFAIFFYFFANSRPDGGNPACIRLPEDCIFIFQPFVPIPFLPDFPNPSNTGDV